MFPGVVAYVPRAVVARPLYRIVPARAYRQAKHSAAPPRPAANTYCAGRNSLPTPSCNPQFAPGTHHASANHDMSPTFARATPLGRTKIRGRRPLETPVIAQPSPSQSMEGRINISPSHRSRSRRICEAHEIHSQGVESTGGARMNRSRSRLKRPHLQDIRPTSNRRAQVHLTKCMFSFCSDRARHLITPPGEPRECARAPVSRALQSRRRPLPPIAPVRPRRGDRFFCIQAHLGTSGQQLCA